MCFGWKGGIGTASRVLPIELGGFTLGALVQSNFGRPRDLVIAGCRSGDRCNRQSANNKIDDKGSIMIVLATDAPLEARQCIACVCGRVRDWRGSAVITATAAAISSSGSARPIGLSTNRSGWTGTRAVLIDEARVIDGLFRAVVESVEEAIVNSLFGAETMVGRDDHVGPGAARGRGVEVDPALICVDGAGQHRGRQACPKKSGVSTRFARDAARGAASS